MSYSIRLRDSKFRIDRRHFDAAIVDLPILSVDDYGRLKNKARAILANASITPSFRSAKALEALFCLGNFEVELGPEGIRSIEFVGLGSGRGEEEVLATAAPYVAEGSFLEFRGEDGEEWRYLFLGGKVGTVKPTIGWPTSFERSVLDIPPEIVGARAKSKARK